MTDYRIQFIYTANGEVVITAESLSEAVEKAKKTLPDRIIPAGGEKEDIIWSDDSVEVVE